LSISELDDLSYKFHNLFCSLLANSFGSYHTQKLQNESYHQVKGSSNNLTKVQLHSWIRLHMFANVKCKQQLGCFHYINLPKYHEWQINTTLNIDVRPGIWYLQGCSYFLILLLLYFWCDISFGMVV
jgi:hypothetical protein